MNTKLNFDAAQMSAKLWLAVGGGILALGAVVWLLANPDILGGIMLAVLIGAAVLVVVAAWMTPIIIAVKRQHPSLLAIVVINIVFGWTFLGWMVALIWSLSNNSSGNQTVVINQGVASTDDRQVTGMPDIVSIPQLPQYQVGDMVNGHRFNGVSWEPLPQGQPR